MTDRIDARLQEYAGRWRDSLPAPQLDPTRLPAQSRRRRWAVGAAAAAVLAVATLAAMAVGLRGDGPDEVLRPIGPTTVKPGDVIPWAALPTTAPTIPVSTVAGSPDPALADGLPPCDAGQLRATRDLEGAMGTMYLLLTVELERPGPPCRLMGVPGVEPMSHGQVVDIPLQPATGDGPVAFYSDPVVISETSRAVIALGLTTHWCAPPLDNDRLRISFPGGIGSFLTPGFGRLSGCDAVAGSGPQPITVWPIAPRDVRPPEVRSAWADVTLSPWLDLTGTPGEAVDFVVTLTAPREVSLRDCPDFTISMYGRRVGRQTSYGLNCAQVPYRDAEGDPVLPAGVPVGFAMRVTAPEYDVEKFVWELDVPEHLAVGGHLTVG